MHRLRSSRLTSISTDPSWPANLLGRHYLAEFADCPAAGISTVASVERLFIDTLASHGGTILGQVTHQFEPFGATIVVMLAESHASLHTWPESNSVCIDMFSCTPALDADTAITDLAQVLKAGRVNRQTLDRSFPQ